MPTPPVVKFHEFDTSNISPSGERHLTTASGFVKELGVGAGEFLDYGSKNISAGKQNTDTKAVVAFLSQLNDMNEAVFNLRFWVTDFTDFGAGSFNFNGFPSGQWIQNISLTDASGKFVPTNLPSGQNWWRDAGGPFNRNDVAFQEITGSGTDDQVTQFFYLSVAVDNDVPPKTYGGDAGGFTYRCSFDYR